tara:strand:+ start:425 stop:826 length:402 start_codon:yes stop_codon:yes gene_type:complete
MVIMDLIFIDAQYYGERLNLDKIEQQLNDWKEKPDTFTVVVKKLLDPSGNFLTKGDGCAYEFRYSPEAIRDILKIVNVIFPKDKPKEFYDNACKSWELLLRNPDKLKELREVHHDILVNLKNINKDISGNSNK